MNEEAGGRVLAFAFAFAILAICALASLGALDAGAARGEAVPVPAPVERVHIDSALAVSCYARGAALSCVWTPEVAEGGY